MKRRELVNMGFPDAVVKTALAAASAAATAGLNAAQIRGLLRDVLDDVDAVAADPMFGPLAAELAAVRSAGGTFVPREEPAPYRRWGAELEADAIRQIENACRLPVAARGALMPDAHVGYGLPIGGVLGTRNAVIPFAVGVDIACRMKLTVLDLPAATIEKAPQTLERVLEEETRFGIGATFRRRRDHDVLDDDWSVSRTTAKLKDKAWAQLGTSGSGNHFVEFGVLSVEREEKGVDLPPGEYLAVLSHSGSRGTGATVADHYSKLAMQAHPELPRELRHLAWLDLDTQEGQEYWAAMQLMGRYAAANHACIHRHIARHLGADVLLDLENHHNFAWIEEHFGETLVVHRKGATPAGAGVLGVIPGSMATPTYVVRGKGNPESLGSASHGAGRRMSRTTAKQQFTWNAVRGLLDERRVRVLSAGVDEVPMVYKDIDEVMSAQDDLVESLATFMPRIVKMAPGSEPAED